MSRPANHKVSPALRPKKVSLRDLEPLNLGDKLQPSVGTIGDRIENLHIRLQDTHSPKPGSDSEEESSPVTTFIESYISSINEDNVNEMKELILFTINSITDPKAIADALEYTIYLLTQGELNIIVVKNIISEFDFEKISPFRKLELLSHLALNNHHEIIGPFLDKFPEANLRSCSGKSPFIHAAEAGKKETVKLFIQNDLVPEFSQPDKFNAGKDFNIENKFKNFVNYLIDNKPGFVKSLADTPEEYALVSSYLDPVEENLFYFPGPSLAFHRVFGSKDFTEVIDDSWEYFLENYKENYRQAMLELKQDIGKMELNYEAKKADLVSHHVDLASTSPSPAPAPVSTDIVTEGMNSAGCYAGK